MFRTHQQIASCVIALALMVALACAGGCANGWGGSQPVGGEGESVAMSATSLAREAVRVGDLSTARIQFARAIEVNPRYVPAYMGMADLCRLEADYASAERHYGQAARLEPSNFDAQYYHGLMLHLLERLGEAISAYLRAVSLNPSDFKANLHLATAYYQLDENRAALLYAERAVQLKPRDGSARFNLGAIQAALGDHQSAVIEYQQAAELMDLTPELLLNLAQSLGRVKRYEEMRNTLQELLRREQTALGYERLGFAEFRLGAYDAALEAFRAAAAIDPSHYPAHNGVGVCLLNTWIESGHADDGLRSEALDALRTSLRIQRDQPRIVEILTRYSR